MPTASFRKLPEWEEDPDDKRQRLYMERAAHRAASQRILRRKKLDATAEGYGPALVAIRELSAHGGHPAVRLRRSFLQLDKIREREIDPDLDPHLVGTHRDRLKQAIAA